MVGARKAPARGAIADDTTPVPFTQSTTNDLAGGRAASIGVNGLAAWATAEWKRVGEDVSYTM